MQTEDLLPDTAFMLDDWGASLWENYNFNPIIASPSDQTSTEHKPVRRQPRILDSNAAIHFTRVGHVVILPGTDIDFTTLSVEYKGCIIQRCWQGHQVWRKYGPNAIRANCDVHHLMGRPPKCWKFDPKRYIILRYFCREGMRELCLHINSKHGRMPGEKNQITEH
jgi:hypothetical protein